MAHRGMERYAAIAKLVRPQERVLVRAPDAFARALSQALGDRLECSVTSVDGDLPEGDVLVLAGTPNVTLPRQGTCRVIIHAENASHGDAIAALKGEGHANGLTKAQLYSLVEGAGFFVTSLQRIVQEPSIPMDHPEANTREWIVEAAPATEATSLQSQRTQIDALRRELEEHRVAEERLREAERKNAAIPSYFREMASLHKAMEAQSARIKDLEAEVATLRDQLSSRVVKTAQKLSRLVRRVKS